MIFGPIRDFPKSKQRTSRSRGAWPVGYLTIRIARLPARGDHLNRLTLSRRSLQPSARTEVREAVHHASLRSAYRHGGITKRRAQPAQRKSGPYAHTIEAPATGSRFPD